MKNYQVVKENKLKAGYVYLLTNRYDGVLYTGVTSDLIQRIHQHKTKSTESFSEKYNTCLLVWYECHDDIQSAILREKQIKKWNRDWKVELIEEKNPNWNDLYPALLG